ncbi:iron-sulfur cluster assembly protein [Salipaludibacillus sp. CF4.18]|uniref:iron-sulfur cluster assembly protein n=1 Tax=Salipaludibacillus sp. CF4.18 TaxID=3373081 RepID=UPI003EE77B9E
MSKEKEVFEKLDKVFDPELDQPLTELGFINNTEIKNDVVEVVFRLPTYWCSPNFAYIMAEDIHKYVSELEWVNEVKVNLIDHCTSDEINQGVTKGKQFSKSLNEFSLSDGELDELRNTFLIKAFYARQEKLMKSLIKLKMSHEQIISLSVQQLRDLSLSEEDQEIRKRYLEKKVLLQHVSNLAITTPEGEALSVERFPDYLRGAKSTRLSMEFNGHYCRGLLEARYDLPSSNTLEEASTIRK